MAINVDNVYKTVLYVLNKEQRGYLTPEEFNKIATQVQLEIFEKYFEDLNIYSRIQDNNSEYGNRIKNIDEKLDIFKTIGDCNGSDGINLTNIFNVPVPTDPIEFYKLGTVIYKDTEIEKVRPNDLLYINKSPLTKPTAVYPVYTYEGDVIYIYPKTITGTDTSTPISATYIKKPLDVRWGYIPNSNLGYFEYNEDPYTGSNTPLTAGSTDFQLHASEQSEVVLNILMYAGVVVRDPQVIQAASKKIQQDEVAEKS